jgi:hypothetical protein
MGKIPPKQKPHFNEQPYDTPTSQIQPQQYIYTDGSFIPPTKNSEGQT